MTEGPAHAARTVRPATTAAVPGVVRRKLVVGAVDDPAEAEADTLADEVVRRLAEAVQDAPPMLATPATAEQPASRITRRVDEAGPVGPEGGDLDAPTAQRIAGAGGGAAMAGPTRQRMETAFGADFSAVRIHEGAESNELNRALGARAFTTGAHVFLGEGAPAAGTSEGDHLLAHELAHTLQQTGSARASRVVRRDPTVGTNPLYEGASSGTDNPLYQGPAKSEYPKVGEASGEAVLFETDADKFEATVIIDGLASAYNVVVDSKKAMKAIVTQYDKVPKDVRKALTVGVWQMKELRALDRAVGHYAPILGGERAESTRGKAKQEVKYIGKIKQAINTNTAQGVLDTTTLGEYFAKSQTLNLFDKGTNSTVDFADNLKQLEGTAVHEMAHGLFAYAYDDWVKEFDYWKTMFQPSNTVGAEEPPSKYGKKNSKEDLCESVMFYFVEESRLKKDAPLRHAYVKKMIDAWKKDEKSKKKKKK